MDLYLLTFPNGKAYVGITTKTARARYVEHGSMARAGRGLPVYKAWRKMGAPELSVLAVFDDLDALLAAEVVEIARRRCQLPGGYNVTPGGEHSPMRTPSVAAKVAAAKTGKRRGQVHTPESREKIAAAMRGRTMSEESRRKLSEARKGVPSPLRGRKASAEARRNMSEAQRGKPKSPETRRKISEALVGRTQSEETKRKRRETFERKRRERELPDA